MGFLSDLAKSAIHSAQERAQKVNERKEELERRYEYTDDEALFRALFRYTPTSIDFAALSLMLQDRGYSGEEITRRYNQAKHHHK